jgi:hypothetical protein
MEYIPQLVIISIFLFVAGLLDNLFAISRQLDGVASTSLSAASKVCSAVFALVIIILASTIIYTSINPDSSPFRSKIARLITRLYQTIWRVALLGMIGILRLGFPEDIVHDDALQVGFLFSRQGWTLWAFKRYLTFTRWLDSMDQVDGTRAGLSNDNIVTYLSITSQTFDDSLLDDALSALENMFFHARVRFLQGSVQEPWTLLEYLLSPQASRRSIVTVASAITHGGE